MGYAINAMPSLAGVAASILLITIRATMAGLSQWALLAIAAVQLVGCSENVVEEVVARTYEPSWRYKCVTDKGCERTSHPSSDLTSNSSSLVFSSLDVCRTVCGRFGGLWPRPITAVIGMQTVMIHPNYLRFDLQNVPSEALSLMVEMTKLVGPNLLAECDGVVTNVAETPVVVYLNVKSSDITLTWNTDEEYMLDVQTKEDQISVHVTATTIYGARHALETFSQLVVSDRPDYSDQHTCSLLLVSGAKIRDRPTYPYRGLLLDTSRHFIPMKDVLRTIDGMAANKMNVFHWHVTDTHSFPLESTRVPQFTRYGAYSAQEIYSAEEVRKLITYAQVRGVRVVIEIDSPAHAGNGWQWGPEYNLGDLAVCVNQWPWRHLCVQPPCGQLNPANQAVYRVLGDLYRDIVDAVPAPALLHMGGDEVYIECWNTTDEITEYMKQQNYDTSTTEGFIKLWAEFHEKALKAWDEAVEAVGTPKQPVMLWSSELTQAARITQNLDKERYVIEVWEPASNPLLHQLIKLGYKTVSIPKDVWYLDRGFWGNTKYNNWRKMYAHTLPRDDNFLGGEVAMWTEYIDEQGLDTRIWPRAAAVAERLWADPAASVYSAEPRMQRQRQRLITRGLSADAISPQWCTQHDSRCF
ncbi:hypothetical protein PYW08_013282 [Mythimna loreyi]|uniref:Uncharacterized protein n=1 Tax=Mythimna loreyi TaxID=667449 RepID=A0ACC2QGB5_9NEOP|nr:hypothetical protein PYW08_013282 [Mythimna loreyi]